FEVAGRRQVDAALALDRLDEDGARLAVDQLGRRAEVAERGVAEARQQRFESLVILRLAGGAERAHRAAVEAVEHRDDLVAARLAEQPRDLDHRLVGLGAAVSEDTLTA